MELNKASELAIKLMSKHGLIDLGWSFRFDAAKKRYGCCLYSQKTITLSRGLTQLRRMTHVKNTILHEIAHALVGPGHDHDFVWMAKAIEIGCNGKIRSSDAAMPPVWVGICPVGHQFNFYRRPTKNKSCGICFPNVYNNKFKLQIKRYDQDT